MVFKYTEKNVILNHNGLDFLLIKRLISTLIDSFGIKGKALRRSVDGCEHNKYA